MSLAASSLPACTRFLKWWFMILLRSFSENCIATHPLGIAGCNNRAPSDRGQSSQQDRGKAVAGTEPATATDRPSRLFDCYCSDFRLLAGARPHVRRLRPMYLWQHYREDAAFQ